VAVTGEQHRGRQAAQTGAEYEDSGHCAPPGGLRPESDREVLT
jgi:hypothetical protein